jgi:hypothetical protein
MFKDPGIGYPLRLILDRKKQKKGTLLWYKILLALLTMIIHPLTRPEVPILLTKEEIVAVLAPIRARELPVFEFEVAEAPPHIDGGKGRVRGRNWPGVTVKGTGCQCRNR